jgi:hypothetical protein
MMAFIRQKTVDGRRYYQVVRNYREEGQHKQEILCHLGPHSSLDEVIDEVSKEAKHDEEKAAEYREQSQEAKKQLLDTYGALLGDEIPSKHEVHPRWRDLCYERQWEYRRHDSYSLDGQAKERWQAEWITECLMYEAIFTYHTLLEIAADYNKRASVNRMRLNKLEAISEMYF